jgi:hypothetical protein
MTRRSSPASGPAQGKFTVEQPCNLLQTIGLDTPRRQFDGKRVAAELATDIAGDLDVLIRQFDRAAARRRALHEEFYGREAEQLGGRQTRAIRRGFEGRQPVDVFAANAQDFPAGHQQVKLRQFGKKPLRQGRSLRNKMFGAVEDQQDGPAAQMADQSRNRVAGLNRQAERGDDGWCQQARIGDRAQLHKADGAKNSGSNVCATESATVVLPNPPGPTMVTNRSVVSL